MILEVDRSYVRDFYNGNLEECIKQRDGVMWTPERIKVAFNNGKGNEKDLKRYMKDNRKYAYFCAIKEEITMLNATSRQSNI